MPSPSIYAQLDTSSLLALLTKERANLATVAAQSSNYASSDQPLHQHNLLEEIFQRIQQITTELTIRGVAIPAPHGTDTPTTIISAASPEVVSGGQRVTARNRSVIRGVQQQRSDAVEQIVEALDQSEISDTLQQSGSPPDQA